MFGKKLDYNVGKWKEHYNIEDDIEMEGMVYQIITETVRVITTASNSLKEEERYFTMAFNDLDKVNISTNNSQINNELSLIKNFFSIKNKLYISNDYDENIIIKLKKELDKSKFAFMCYPLFKSIFLSLRLESYNESKTEFDKAYA